ncbi:hypothetical protein PEX1_046290 [Penicillium expansum]|uniref:Zn(2)-C6 fungal-type domain-containing protein n=1 Tax=Penicillium expansum TaxID=27334 RepID=A0A0A2KBS0_PENEN|nr:hypothetical protein PEX2_082540 [Penicillium expansum]KGO52607.1 hypothetical protein PEX2_082540 [Penicillium expansum]KGO64321.1 hypothetical protein PEX1_046290 [Penicillium expansum]
MYNEHPTRNTRSPHTKSRLGCKTCKIRHKKCDETHPACFECTSTGRECDGYEQAVDKRTREWREFKAKDSTNSQNNATLQIRYRSKVRPSVTAVPLPLAGVCQIDLNWNERWHLDFYRNCTGRDLYSARYHLTSGYKLFKEWDVQGDNDDTALALRQVFAQLHVQWFFCSNFEIFVEHTELLYGEDRRSSNTTVGLSKDTPHLYSGIDQMDRVQEFAMFVSGLVLDLTICGYDIGPASSIGRGAKVALTKLRLCRSRLIAVLVYLDGLAPEDCDSLKLFSLWIDIIDIKLAVSKSQKPDEMVYDDHLEQFQNITKLLKTLAGLDSGPTDIELSSFNYRHTIVPGLLWSTTKCRDWQVRRDMCYIMHMRPRDDYWLSATAVALKRLIEVESAGVKPGDIIPEAARAYSVNVKIQSEESKVELRYRRPQDVPHRKDGSDEWEIDSMNY